MISLLKKYESHFHTIVIPFFSLKIQSMQIMLIWTNLSCPRISRITNRKNRIVLMIIWLFSVNNSLKSFQSRYFLLIAKSIFSNAPYLNYVLSFLRIPMKNTVDTFVRDYIENKVDDVLYDEENIINAIHALRGWYPILHFKNIFSSLDTIFPNDTKESR